MSPQPHLAEIGLADTAIKHARLAVPHDPQRWGPPRAAIAGRPHLVRLVDLVRALSVADERAMPDAAGIVLDRIGDAVLYLLDPLADGRAVATADRFNKIWPTGHAPGVASFWESPQPEPVSADFFHGPAGLVQWMQKHWCNEPERGNAGAIGGEWDEDCAAPAAMLLSDALSMFPEVFNLAESRPDGATAEGSSPGSSALQVVQPGSGQWPHNDGQAWTDAEREALFLMRHRDKRTGAELARIAGVKRQRVDELIGGAKPHGGASKARGKDGWQPSAELLAACGRALQPLQSAAQAMTA